MKTILYSSFVLLLFLINSTLHAQNAQDKMVNNIYQSDFAICYAKINNYDSIPFLEVEGQENNLISEELVFALDIAFDNAIIEIEEGVFIQFTYSIEPVNTNKAIYEELLVMPLHYISKQMGIEFYGIINRPYKNDKS